MTRSLSLPAIILTIVSLTPSLLAQCGLTTLQGFFASQTNQCLRIGNRIDVVFSASPDSIPQHKFTYYATSTDGGFFWNSFNYVQVPNRFSWHPTLDLGKGTARDCPVSPLNPMSQVPQTVRSSCSPEGCLLPNATSRVLPIT